MEEKRRRVSSAWGEDELVLAKTAAWAWFQRGSAKEGRPTREFDLARIPARAPRPSRFKLEALRAAQPDPPSCAVSKTGTESPRNSLLDIFKVERIMRELNLSVGERRMEAAPTSPRAATKRSGGFWARYAVALCGSTGGVVEARALAARRRRGKPEPISAVVA